MSVEPVDALELEAARTGGFLAGLSPDDWERPTRCPPMNLRELAVHTLRGGLRLVEFLDGMTPIDAEPEKDAVTYFQYDPVATGAGVVARAKAEAEARAGQAIDAVWPDAWKAALERARAYLADDPVIRTPFGTIRLREYVRTRCVEVTIHAMDLRDAVGLEPDPTPAGLDVACGVLVGLLGADPRRLGMDPIRFALVGTGRGALTDTEAETLGPLSDSFPLLQ